MNTAVQLAVWLDRTGTLGNLPSIETYSCGWNSVKTTTWYKVLAKELTTYYKVIGNKNASAVADNMIRCVLDNYYAQDYTSDIQVFEYLHSTKPDYYQPLLVIWYK